MNPEQRKKITPVIILTPESGPLPTHLGDAAEWYNSKKGGLGDVIPALTKGLTELGYDLHIIMPNLKNQFERRGGVSDKTKEAQRHQVQSRNIHLLESHHIRNLEHIYAGNQKFTAARYQSLAFPIIKEIRAQFGRKGIVISNDWMTGGWLSAYLRTRNVPILHMMHNIHTANIPLDYYFDIPMSDFRHNFFLNLSNPDEIDAHATAVKNATYVGVVGGTFLEEFVFGKIPGYTPWTVQQELAEKYKVGHAIALPNGLYADLLPENQDDIFNKYQGIKFGPETKDLVSAKKHNLAKLQEATGLEKNENATLYFWPSRLDDFQKGGRLLVESIGKFVYDNPNAQVLVVADPTNEQEEGLQRAMTNIALDSQGKIAYYSFDKDLSIFAYSAATAILSAPKFEPYGFFIPQGQACGDLIITTRAGGGNDMVTQYNPTTFTGNGIHLSRHTPEAFYRAMKQTVDIHNYWKKNDDRYNAELRRIMKTARQEQSLDNMIKGYDNILQTMNGGPLF